MQMRQVASECQVFQLKPLQQQLRQALSDRQLLENRLFTSEAKLRSVFEAMTDIVLILDLSGDRIEVMPTQAVLSNSFDRDLINLTVDRFLSRNESDLAETFFHQVQFVLETRQTVIFEYSLKLEEESNEESSPRSASSLEVKTEQEVWFTATISPISEDSVIWVARNITESRQLTRKLIWQASHDALTGLVNRRQFKEELSKAISSVHREPHQYVLCYLDLDRFKVVNDTCGHAAGDRLLCQVTALIQNHIRPIDTLARLGGDEFALLIDRCSMAEAKLIANHLQELIQHFQFVWQGKRFRIGVSIGLVALDETVQDITTVLSAADMACYAAKKRGRNCICVYREDDLDLTGQQSDRYWSLQVRRALEENRLCLYSQQIVSLKPGDTREHYEILLRLIDEEGQLILPGIFLPAAERYDLMGEIDRWVIRTFFACYQRFRQTQPHGFNGDDCIYAIALSGASLNNNRFLSFLQQQFLQYNIAPQTICFEITETTVISNLTQATALIPSLKELGCHLALDDFGMGMSSLSYLKSLPVNYLKIDGNFVKDLVRDPVDRALVECCHRIAHVMNIKTIAKFAEDRTTLKELKKLGIDYAQGYGIAQPIPLVLA
jgi:diguanylate cyclase (GGDEF)-like protein